MLRLCSWRVVCSTGVLKTPVKGAANQAASTGDLGPARILATETRREPDGSLKPGGAVYFIASVRSGTLKNTQERY